MIERRKGNMELKEHEHSTKTSTPLKHHHPLSWYVKWASSIVLVFAMIATTNNMYPMNMILQGIGVAGWLWVAIIWNYRALIVVNAVAVAIIANGVLVWIMT